MENLELFYTLMGMGNGTSTGENYLIDFFIKLNIYISYHPAIP